jgi:euchromatic histone-lysine N-methyltransferase
MFQSCRCTDSCSTANCLCAHISLRCWYDEEGRLLPDFNFSDPPLLFECNTGCGCNRVTCNNRVIQHGPTARFQLFRTDGKGWGVRTLRAITKGTYVCEWVFLSSAVSFRSTSHTCKNSYFWCVFLSNNIENALKG